MATAPGGKPDLNGVWVLGSLGSTRTSRGALRKQQLGIASELSRSSHEEGLISPPTTEEVVDGGQKSEGQIEPSVHPYGFSFHVGAGHGGGV